MYNSRLWILVLLLEEDAMLKTPTVGDWFVWFSIRMIAVFIGSLLISLDYGLNVGIGLILLFFSLIFRSSI